MEVVDKDLSPQLVQQRLDQNDALLAEWSNLLRGPQQELVLRGGQPGEAPWRQHTLFTACAASRPPLPLGTHAHIYTTTHSLRGDRCMPVVMLACIDSSYLGLPSSPTVTTYHDTYAPPHPSYQTHPYICLHTCPLSKPLSWTCTRRRKLRASKAWSTKTWRGWLKWPTNIAE